MGVDRGREEPADSHFGKTKVSSRRITGSFWDSFRAE